MWPCWSRRNLIEEDMSLVVAFDISKARASPGLFLSAYRSGYSSQLLPQHLPACFRTSCQDDKELNF